MSSLEILAPAGNPSALKTAINHGANAVYLGLQNFNARISADNFTTENIAFYVNLAHKFGVKVYVTVNTVVNNNEMPQLIETVRSAVEAKVDAFLVQDFGIADVLIKCFPGINLHASTQMGVHNLYGAQMAEKLGFTRVVLSREAKLEDIKQIKQNTNVEIEYFVQGALCIAFSGNCYFSGMAQDDSGNRGRCKQYCRMKYTSSQNTEENTEKYLLSARDLCLLKNLETLIEAGVTSFKIEGRLRRDGYVAQAVDSYVNAINFIKKKQVLNIKEETHKLTKVFSRGEFNTDAYLFNKNPDNVVNKDVQNHLGIRIGKVKKVERFKDLQKVTIKSSHKIHEGDGLKFLENEIQVCSLGVGNVEIMPNNCYVIYTKHKIKENFDVNLILDSVVEGELVRKEKKLLVNAKIVAQVGKPLVCEMQTEEVRCLHKSSFVLEGAKKCPTTKQEIEEQFAKLGDTIFELNNCVVESEEVFVPKSLLNNFRRECVKELEDCIVLHNEQKINVKIDEKAIKNIEKTIHQTIKELLPNICVFNEQNVEFIIKNKNLFSNQILVFSPQNFSVAQIEKVFAKLKGFNLGINLPIITNYADLKIINELLERNKNLIVVANNVYGLKFANTHKVVAGIGFNVFNDYSVAHLKRRGVVACVASVEQSASLINNGVHLYVLGFVPLMTFAHCPYKTINANTCQKCSFKAGLSFVDVSKNEYAIRRYVVSQCYFELLNSSLINGLGCFENPSYLDIRELDDGVVLQAMNALNLGTKVKLIKKESTGKLFESVK